MTQAEQPAIPAWNIRRFELADQDAVLRLWQRCDLVRPWNDPRRDIARKLAVGRELFLLGLRDGVVVASVMGGYDGHRGWVNYLAVDPAWRRRGLGAAMMAALEQALRALGCAKINLQIRNSNLPAQGFYRALGYVGDKVVSMGKRLEHDG